MQHDRRHIPISSHADFRSYMKREIPDAKNIESEHQNEWDDFCDNLEETLNIEGMQPYIFNRFEDEFEELWNKWQFFLEYALKNPGLQVQEKETLNILLIRQDQIKESYLNFDPNFIKETREIIKPLQETAIKNNNKKNKGLFLVPK